MLDNYFNFTEDKTEWKGTKVIFEISKIDYKTQLCFTHEGLVPEYECFNVCSNAWGSWARFEYAELESISFAHEESETAYRALQGSGR